MGYLSPFWLCQFGMIMVFLNKIKEKTQRNLLTEHDFFNKVDHLYQYSKQGPD